MSARNRRTHLRAKTRTRDPMQEYDRLPPELRAWLRDATLPWGARSVRQLFERALARTGDATSALARLDAAQRRLVAKDAAQVWGRDHPAANSAGMDIAERSGRG